MTSGLLQIIRFTNRHAGKIFLFGLAAVAAHNWLLWKKDRELLARVARPEPLPSLETWPNLPLVSVLVAAWNEADNIERHIQSFLKLRYPHKELVLCAGGTDGTYQTVMKYTGGQILVLEQQPGEGKQRALARGFALVGGEIIFLTDADCRLTDEPFERTLWPVASGLDQAATGSLQPLHDQLADPFAFTKAATQVYGAFHAPEYAPGIQGCNCAVSRSLLAETAAFDAPASTGTDYVLAKTLAAAGTRIRQVPHSRIATEYPVTVRAYLRQQRRWLRNVVLHGRRFGAASEVRAVLRTSLVGLAMLLLPLVGVIFAPWLLVVWGGLVGQALLSRLRYLAFAGNVLGRPVRPADGLWQGPLLLLDFAAWTQPLVDHVRQRGRWGW